MNALFRSAKLGLLEACRFTGVNRAVHGSRWRSRRLLILCYHGISLEDEHGWRPQLFLPQDKFRQHLEILRGLGTNVLAFPEAMERLRTGDLPPRATAITFDDGFHNYAVAAAPILEEFGYPATLYLTTYYVDNQLPVPEVSAGYLLWKHREKRAVLGRDLGFREDIELGSPEGRAKAVAALARMMPNLNAENKHSLLAAIADRLDVDFDRWQAKRLFHLMNPAEIRQLCKDPAFDLQMHTHRHRTPREKAPFVREIRDNRDRIEALFGRSPVHFCYPSGDYDMRFLPWLRECGVETATTCIAGLASPGHDPLLLPRALDWDEVTGSELRGWQSGTEFLLRRAYEHDRVSAASTPSEGVARSRVPEGTAV
ncbi:MAG: polysaccharide deacetylase family protein [Bryobacteraceae bacterium]